MSLVSLKSYGLLPALFLSLFVGLSSASDATAADKHTNFVFFLVDDLGWTDLGCFGSSFYETPNVDRLADSAVRFTNAYAACPVCSPTRASILTGKYPQRVGVTDFISPSGNNQPEKWNRKTKLLPAPYQDHLALEEVTLPEVLKKAGYATFFAGKWHLGSKGFFPEDQGFDVNMGGIERGGPYGGKRYFSPYGNERLTDGPAGEHLPDRLATETAKFIETNKDQPFFAYLSFYSVHTPLMSRADLKLKYEEKREKLDTQEIWGTEGARKVRLVQEHAVYGGMVEAMDQAVGKVLNKLDELKLADQTVVMFMSDNGGLSTSEGHPTSNLPLRGGKGWMYEGGIREPMMVRWPGVTKNGTITDTYVTSTDFFPTILEMAGLPLQSNIHKDGKSFTALLQGKKFSRGPIYWHYPHYGNQGGSPTAAVRDGNWKLIKWYEDDKLELFNLANDISETKNLADSKPEVRDELLTKINAWKKEVGAIDPAVNHKLK